MEWKLYFQYSLNMFLLNVALQKHIIWYIVFILRTTTMPSSIYCLVIQAVFYVQKLDMSIPIESIKIISEMLSNPINWFSIVYTPLWINVQSVLIWQLSIWDNLRIKRDNTIWELKSGINNNSYNTLNTDKWLNHYTKNMYTHIENKYFINR